MHARGVSGRLLDLRLELPSRTEGGSHCQVPNSSLNFAVDVWVDFCHGGFFPRKKAPKKPTKTTPTKFTQKLVLKNSPRISAEAFLIIISGVSVTLTFGGA